MFMPGVWFLWSKKIVIIFQKENGNTFTLLIIFILKNLQIYYYDPQSVRKNLQSIQSPWTLTLLWALFSKIASFFNLSLNVQRMERNVYVVVRIWNQSLYIRTAIISVIIYNDRKKSVCIYNGQLKPVIIYNDQQFSLPFHKQTSMFA